MRWLLRSVFLSLLFLSMDAKAQTDKFYDYYEQLTFHIYTGKPDSAVLPFLKNHFPYLAKTPEPGGWTIYPPGVKKEPKKGLHSLLLDIHPFIKTQHTGARLDLITQEWEDGPPGIEHTRIWVYFNSRSLAEKAREEVVQQFRDCGTNIQFSNKDDKKITIDRVVPKEEDFFHDMYIFMKKDSNEKQYCLLFTFGDDNGDDW